MSRILLVAGALVVVTTSADARPVWRTYPTPLPPQVHLSKVRPAWIGPIWRRVVLPAAVEITPVAADQPTPTSWKQVSTAPLAAEPVIATDPPPPVVVAKAPEPAPVAPVAKPAPAAQPAPIVVAEKTLDPPLPATPTAAPAVLETASPTTPWLDYIAAFVMAIVLGAVIYFFTRDRKRTA